MVNVLPRSFPRTNFELLPLNAGMENVENVVEDLVVGIFRTRTLYRFFQEGLDVPIEIMLRDLYGEFFQRQFLFDFCFR